MNDLDIIQDGLRMDLINDQVYEYGMCKVRENKIW